MFPKGTTCTIGSWPFRDVEKTLDLVLERFPALPAWPQLPNRRFLENMYVQFSEGLPRLVVDEPAQKIHFDTSGDFFPAIQGVYEEFLAGNWARFGISSDYASGLFALERRAQRNGRLKAVKGQTLGPVSLCLTLTDENKKLILYHEHLADAVLKVCVAKAAWQVLFLKELADTTVLFVDEPYLVSYGSAYINLSRTQVVGMLSEVIDKVHELGAVAGLHCCGNTDWSIVADTGVDIISFDAYGCSESLLLYPREIQTFLEKDNRRYLAWGIVPTSASSLETETPESLLARLRVCHAKLAGLGVDRGLLEDRTILTPACGAGPLPEPAALRLVELLTGVARLYAEA